MMSNEKRASYRLSRLIEQSLFDLNLPCQEDYLLSWVVLCSRPPAGNCSLCQNLFAVSTKRAITLTCGHHVHQECLLTNWRV